MKSRLILFTVAMAALWLSVGCLYPENGRRRERGPEPRQDRDHDRERQHDDRREDRR
jgi:hypothetical protein